MSRQLRVTWTETLIQTAEVEIDADLDLEAALAQFADCEGSLYEQIIDITGGPIGRASCRERV